MRPGDHLNSNILSKVYLALLAVFSAVMAFVSFYAFSWLGSIGQPANAIAGYEFHMGIAWPFLWISAIILLILGNGVLWMTRNSWAMWVALIYFSFWVVLRYFVLERAFAGFVAEHRLADGPAVAGVFIGVVLILVAAAVTFFNQFLVVRLREKTYPDPPSPEKPELS